LAKNRLPSTDATENLAEMGKMHCYRRIDILFAATKISNIMTIAVGKIAEG
jgi:hypothetical protein